jgi:hypothetical protein
VTPDLGDYGAAATDPVRTVDATPSAVLCPACGDDVGYSSGDHPLPVSVVADPELRDALLDADTDVVDVDGYRCHGCEVWLPETVESEAANGYPSGRVGVPVRFSDGATRHVPARAASVPVVEPTNDGTRENAESGSVSDSSTTPVERSRDESETRVAHVEHDAGAIDHYVGRGPDGEDLLTDDVDVGEPGWLGNPYDVETFGREDAVSMYKDALLTRLENRPQWARELARVRGDVLGCYCRRLDENSPTCHADVIAAVVDRALLVEPPADDVDTATHPDDTADDDGDPRGSPAEPELRTDGGFSPGDPCPVCGGPARERTTFDPGEGPNDTPRPVAGYYHDGHRICLDSSPGPDARESESFDDPTPVTDS